MSISQEVKINSKIVWCCGAVRTDPTDFTQCEECQKCVSSDCEDNGHLIEYNGSAYCVECAPTCDHCGYTITEQEDFKDAKVCVECSNVCCNECFHEGIEGKEDIIVCTDCAGYETE